MFSAAKKFYRKHINCPWFERLIKHFINGFVNFYAGLKRFSFPANYVWSQKMEMMREEYEAETVKFVRKIVKSGMVVMDIGAHIGYYTRIFSELVGHEGEVLAFEPEPENFFLLKRNTKDLENVELFNFAVSNRKEEIPFYTAEKTGAHSAIKSDARPKEIRVSAVRFDEFVLEKGFEKVDLVKIDIEGGEPRAIEGMADTIRKNPALKIIFEFSPENLGLAEIDGADVLQKIQSFGFEIFAIRKTGLEKLSQSQINGLKPVVAPSDFLNLFCRQLDQK